MRSLLTVPKMNTVFISVLSSYKQTGVPRSPHDASGWVYCPAISKSLLGETDPELIYTDAGIDLFL